MWGAICRYQCRAECNIGGLLLHLKDTIYAVSLSLFIVYTIVVEVEKLV